MAGSRSTLDFNRMPESSGIDFTLDLDANACQRVQVQINGRPLEMVSERFVMYRANDRVHTFVIRADRRGLRHPAPYPVHTHVLTSQQRDAERRRAAMTPTANAAVQELIIPSSDAPDMLPSLAQIRLTTLSAAGPMEFLKPGLDDLTQVRAANAEDSPDVCVICLSAYEGEDSVRVLLCNHKYHKLCIDRWFAQLQNCPICRMGIDGNPHVLQEEEANGNRVLLGPGFPTTTTNLTFGAQNSIISLTTERGNEPQIIVID